MNQDKPILFVVPGDLHLTDAEQPNYRHALQIVDEINDLIQPDFVQFIGDNVQEAEAVQFALFDTLRSRLTAPHDVMVGDHDVHEDPGAKRFQQFVGATYGTRAFPGVRFIRLNTQQSKPVGISDEQIAWFRAEVGAALSAGDQIVLFQHNYPFQIWEDFAGQNTDAWREIVQTSRIAAIICGHTHYFQEANDGRNISVAVRSIGDPEGGAPGYLVGYLHGDDLAFAYRTVEETGPFVLVTHPRESLLATGPRHVVRADDEMRVLIRSAAPVESARWKVEAGDWHDLGSSADDIWTGALSIEGLTKGNHTLTVEAQDAQGQAGRREQEFFVDTTGRYTAVPRVRPVVSQTKFC